MQFLKKQGYLKNLVNTKRIVIFQIYRRKSREINIIRKCDSEMEAPVQSKLNIQDGENRIKLVADKDTKFDIEVSIAEGDFSRIGF